MSWERFFDRMVQVKVQLDFARGALHTFEKTPEAVERYLREDLEGFRRLITEGTKTSGIDPKGSWAYQEEGVGKFFASGRDSLLGRLDEVGFRLNQSQLLLWIAIFEAFMKDCHYEILKQQPKLMDPDRKVALGRLVAIGMNDLLEEEIRRQVSALDRMSIEAQDKYWCETLKVNWFDGKAAPVLKIALDHRNKILHEDPDAATDDDMLGLCLTICTGISWVTIVHGAVLYPKGFALPNLLSEKDARSLVEGRYGNDSSKR